MYNVKDEELPFIAKFLLFNLKRDFADFAEYLPKIFTVEYVNEFEQKIIVTDNLINPQSETVELKNTTAHLYSVMDNLIAPIDRVKGYIQFTKGAIPITVKDFGLVALKQKIHARDAEGALKNLKTVTTNLQKYKAQLMEQGLTEDIIECFNAAVEPIETDNQKQFEIMNERKVIVRDNKNLINDLYKVIIEICNVGKAIYKGKDTLKVQDYTFNELKKKVRIVARSSKKEETEEKENQSNPS
jgi:hypothetical protein